MIRLERVGKTFDGRTGNVHAVQDVTLTTQDKEIYGIIGFSGVDKLTLVRCVSLLEHPGRGAIVVDDQDITKMEDRELKAMRKKIGMVFQHFSLTHSRTVYQNIASPLKGNGLSKAEMDQKIRRLLELVNLSDRIDAYPSQLSDGQKQRIAIARVLTNDPKVLLYGETIGALGPQTIRSTLKLLKRVNKELGITTILIAHKTAVIKEIYDRVVVMGNGYIVEEGSIIDIFSKPQTEVTRNLIASVSNARRVQGVLDTDASAARPEKGQRMVKLNYDSISTSKALISEVSKWFLVDTNIILGNVETIKNIPLGDLIVILNGEGAHIDQALAYLKAHEVSVEVVESC